MKTKVLLNMAIENEKAGKLYSRSDSDGRLVDEMMRCINISLGCDIHYIAELDQYSIKGAGAIIDRYIQRFQSETIKAYLIHQLISDHVNGCEKTICRLYTLFKTSKEYISEEDKAAPAHIVVRYDNALRMLKARSIQNELVALAHYPRDVFYLPLTMEMLARWKIPEIEALMIDYLDGSCVNCESIGLPNTAGNYYPSLATIKRELKFTALDGLKSYPSRDNLVRIQLLSESYDDDLKKIAVKTIASIEKHLAASGL